MEDWPEDLIYEYDDASDGLEVKRQQEAASVPKRERKAVPIKRPTNRRAPAAKPQRKLSE